MNTKKISENKYSFPHWSKIDKTYSGAVLKVMEEIKKTRPFYNWRDGQIDEAHLRETPRKAEAMKQVTDKKGIVTIEVQLGDKYKGKSVEEARKAFNPNEFGLGAYEALCILLANPDILKSFDDLFLDCPGDEFDDPDSGVRFDRAPYLDYRSFPRKLFFDTSRVGGARKRFGALSGFVPEALETGTLEPFESSSLSLPRILEINGVKYQKYE